VGQIYVEIEAQGARDEQLSLDNGIPHRPVLIVQVDWIIAPVKGAVCHVDDIAYLDTFVFLNFASQVQRARGNELWIPESFS